MGTSDLRLKCFLLCFVDAPLDATESSAVVPDKTVKEAPVKDVEQEAVAKDTDVAESASLKKRMLPQREKPTKRRGKAGGLKMPEHKASECKRDDSEKFVI
jgi:hypothetical protein